MSGSIWFPVLRLEYLTENWLLLAAANRGGNLISLFTFEF